MFSPKYREIPEGIKEEMKEISSIEQAKEQQEISKLYLEAKKILEGDDFKEEHVEYQGKEWLPKKKLAVLINKRNKVNLEQMKNTHQEITDVYNYFLDQLTLEVDKELED